MARTCGSRLVLERVLQRGVPIRMQARGTDVVCRGVDRQHLAAQASKRLGRFECVGKTVYVCVYARVRVFKRSFECISVYQTTTKAYARANPRLYCWKRGDMYMRVRMRGYAF